MSFCTGGHNMDELSVLDLQNLRHLIGGYDGICIRRL